MTSPYVVLPSTPAPKPSPGWPVLRAMLAVGTVLAGIVGAVIAAFIASITWSGCFIGCTGENHVGGAAIGVVAVVSLASGPAAVSGLYRSAGWMWAAVWTSTAGAFLMMLALSAS